MVHAFRVAGSQPEYNCRLTPLTEQCVCVLHRDVVLNELEVTGALRVDKHVAWHQLRTWRTLNLTPHGLVLDNDRIVTEVCTVLDASVCQKGGCSTERVIAVRSDHQDRSLGVILDAELLDEVKACSLARKRIDRYVAHRCQRSNASAPQPRT